MPLLRYQAINFNYFETMTIKMPVRPAKMEDFTIKGHVLMDRIFYLEGLPEELHGPFTMRDVEPETVKMFLEANRVYVPWMSLKVPSPTATTSPKNT